MNLQNRRKYLRDKGNGKRVHTPNKHGSQGNPSTPTFTSDAVPFRMGQLVNLTSRSNHNKIIAKGIVVSMDAGMFVDLAVKSVMMDCIEDENDLELPLAAGNGDTTLSPQLVNHVIKWKKERLSIKGMKRHPGTHDCTDTEEKGDKVKQKKINLPAGEKKTVQKLPMTNETERHIAEKDDQRKTKKVSPINVEKKNGKECQTNTTEIPKFKNFVLMEYSKKQLYWGILQTAEMTNDFIVRTSSKTFYKMDQLQVSNEEFDVDEMKLSTRDYEVNPDMEYCVWKLPKDNAYLKLAPNGKFGAIALKSILLKNSFLNEFKKKLENYTERE
ncbi:uncharacterized protein LOC117323879 [Pecten maximus]|uniref:uncharacterized protein LOC117323879 n=1 Tax=Pecten maximus TaxID=6579 RepID=UPI001458DAFB|nr:uncharacterized protein LOC117323879 [Pecten maximus]